jgi:hypothetical protein
MAIRGTDLSLSDSIERALEAPWVLLRHDAEGDDVVRAQARDNIEDAGRSEIELGMTTPVGTPSSYFRTHTTPVRTQIIEVRSVSRSPIRR